MSNPQFSSLPFRAYKGPAPFIFVSYCHQDTKRVFDELIGLYKSGYNLWYDEGITTGEEWHEYIAGKIKLSIGFLVFLSETAINSKNVRNEIYNFLDNKKKDDNLKFSAVFLDNVTLPPGLQLEMASIQSLLKFKWENRLFLEKLYESLPVSAKGESRTPNNSPLDSSKKSNRDGIPSTGQNSEINPQKVNPIPIFRSGQQNSSSVLPISSLRKTDSPSKNVLYFCTKCGKRITQKSPKCPNCGSKIDI